MFDFVTHTHTHTHTRARARARTHARAHTRARARARIGRDGISGRTPPRVPEPYIKSNRKHCFHFDMSVQAVSAPFLAAFFPRERARARAMRAEALPLRARAGRLRRLRRQREEGPGEEGQGGEGREEGEEGGGGIVIVSCDAALARRGRGRRGRAPPSRADEDAFSRHGGGRRQAPPRWGCGRARSQAAAHPPGPDEHALVRDQEGAAAGRAWR